MYFVSSFCLESCRASERGLTTRALLDQMSKNERFRLSTGKPVLRRPHSNWTQASLTLGPISFFSYSLCMNLNQADVSIIFTVTLLEAMECLYENLGRDGPLEITGGRGGKKFPMLEFFKGTFACRILVFFRCMHCYSTYTDFCLHVCSTCHPEKSQ